MTQPTVTAIVVTYMTGPRLRECLFALLACRDVSSTIIVDNGNPAEDTAWLTTFAASHSRVKLMKPAGNLGFGRAVNMACREAPEGLLLLVNPDAVIKHDAVEHLMAASEGRRRPWIIGGRIFDLRGTETRGSRRRELTFSRAILTMAGIDRWNLNRAPLPEASILVGAVSGAFMLTSKRCFSHLGGFDERYFLHVEDVDLCRRANEAGGEVVFCPKAGALHYGSTSDVPSSVVANHKADSLGWYFEKFSRNPVSSAFSRLVAKPLLKILLTRRARG